jgi:prepilin-type N-terminal cleavage/methylation domain-containing protein
MISLKNKSKGFTIVELLIVIVVIGILATLVIVTFTGIQQKARNSQRETDINALDSHIEAYYAQTGNYPTLAQVNSSTWRGTNMKGLDPASLVDPKGDATATAPLDGSAASSTKYSYVATHGSGAGATACTSTDVSTDDTACDTFTLTALLEGKTAPDNAYTKSSN